MRQDLGRGFLALLVVLAVTVTVTQVAGAPGVSTAPDGAAVAGVPEAAPSPSFVAANAQVSDFDTIETRIDLRASGDARWQVEFRYELADAATEDAFERARANVSNPPGVFVSRMERAVDEAERATGRTMSVQNGSVETRESVPAGRFGVVSYRFTWTNFADRPEAGRYELGDAIGGMRLGANESLWMEWPDGFGEAAVSPPPAETQPNAVRWRGPLQFRTEDPTVRLTGAGSGQLPGATLLLAGVFGFLLAGAGGYWYLRVRGGPTPTAGGTTAPAGADSPGDAVGAGTPDGPQPGGAADQTTATEQPAESADGEAAAAGSGPPEELLTDEERVLRLLEDADGRMKQQDLIAAVDWSRTKASDVVNEMHEDGRIELYRLGRENVLALPGEIDV